MIGDWFTDPVTVGHVIIFFLLRGIVSGLFSAWVGYWEERERVKLYRLDRVEKLKL